MSITWLLVVGDVDDLRARLRQQGRKLQLRLLRRLQLLRSGLLRLYLRLEFYEEQAGLRLLRPEERPVGLHIGLILDRLQDGLLPRHLVGPSDGELRLRLLHVEAQHLLLR